MIGIFDVGYSDDGSVLVGCVSLAEFEDAAPRREWAVEAGPASPYQPGQFWKRELGPLLRGVQSAADWSVCVIDAYVDLGETRTPGLGRFLHEATGIPVIGVAKSRYAGTPRAYEIQHGSSRRPLFVSAAGLELDEAKKAIKRMAGPNRVPAMIRRADQLSRGLDPQQHS